MNRAPQIWTNTAKDGSGENLLPIVNSDGHLMVDIDMATEGIATEATLLKTVGFALPEYDSITVTYNDGTFTETYVYKLATVTKATITVIYTDATKKKLTSITKS